MDYLDMEHFLRDVWSPEQTFDCFHFDDVKVNEAEDGLPELSIKSETLADTPLGILQDLGSSPSGGTMEMEWMEQYNLLQLLDGSVCDDGSTVEPVVQQGEDFVFNMPSEDMVKSEPDTQEHVSVDEFLHNLLKAPEDQTAQRTLEVATSPVPSPDTQVTPEISFQDESTGLDTVLDCEFLQSPLSTDDVESVLSTACTPLSSSPPPSSPSTVDTTCLFSDDGSITLSSSDLYKVVVNTEKSRSTPYSRPQKAAKTSGKSKGRKQTASISPNPSELELEMMSKKDRKKLQNKNAAIRYRMKKKAESDLKKNEVDDLESTNQELRDKFEELTREIKYMKDLINDVRKAQGLPPLSHLS